MQYVTHLQIFNQLKQKLIYEIFLKLQDIHNIIFLQNTISIEINKAEYLTNRDENQFCGTV
jgi:hypothetical protein